MSDLSRSPLRILVLSNMYPPHHLGGYELSCRDVVQRWRARGHHVTVLTSDLDLGERSRDDDRDVRRTLRFYWDNFEILKPPFRDRLKIERSNHEQLERVIDETKPDVVSVWNMGAMSLGLLTAVGQIGLPLVLVICDDWLIYAPLIDAWTRGFRRWPLGAGLGQKLFGVPTHFRPEQSTTTGCFISETVRARATGHARWAPTRTMIAYNGIDTTDFPLRTPEPRDWGWSLLYVGRVEERKGVGVAVEALAELPRQATLTIDGPVDESFMTRLSTRIGELGLSDRVRFQVSSRAQLHSLYASADAVLFPVLWEEPFGLVPLEAMACATPVIATGTGGSGEFLLDGANCLIAKPGDAGALAAAVHRLAEDRELRDRIVRAGLTTAEALGVDEYARVLEAWHRAAAERYREGEPPGRPPIGELLAPLRRSKG